MKIDKYKDFDKESFPNKRAISIDWWRNELSENERLDLIELNNPGRSINSLTGFEIQKIYESRIDLPKNVKKSNKSPDKR
jgi:hypothetical protein